MNRSNRWTTRTVLLTALLLPAAFALAERGPGPRDAEARFEALSATLELSTDQRTSVREILDAAAERREAFFEAHRGDRDALRAAMRDERTATRDALAAVLTPAQLTTLDEQMQAREARRGERTERRGEARFARLSDALALQESQVEPVREALEAAREERRAAMRAVHDSELDKAAARERMAAVRVRTRERLAGVLTPEQLDRFDAMHEARQGHGEGRGRRERSGSGAGKDPS
jgi:hypothetical protein